MRERIISTDDDNHSGVQRCNNDASNGCMLCRTAWTLSNRRQHCLSCGKLVCSNCSQNRHHIHINSELPPQRVCDLCYSSLFQQDLRSASTASMVTDLDYLEGLGYSREESKRVLKVANGDRRAAVHMLSKSVSLDERSSTKKLLLDNNAWRQEMPDDWIGGVERFNLPHNAESRALHRSPVYISLDRYDYVIGSSDCDFVLDVILKDGRRWKTRRSYRQFCSFKASLPFGTCRRFSSFFPQPAVFSLLLGAGLSKDFLERRLQGLEDWIRELVLSEHCMMSPRVLGALYQFIDIEQHGGEVGVDSAVSLRWLEMQNSSSSPPSSADPSPLLSGLTSPHKDIRDRKLASYGQVRLLDPVKIPVPVSDVYAMLPFKVNVKSLSPADTTTSSSSSAVAVGAHQLVLPIFDERQWKKDFSRDRLVVQGRRIQGSHTEVDCILQLLRHSLLEEVISSQKCVLSSSLLQTDHRPLPPRPLSMNPFDLPSDTASTPSGGSGVGDIARLALHRVSRTESAYSCHSSLMQILDVGNAKQSPHFTPVLITPESLLAEPLEVWFRIVERRSSSGGGSHSPAAPDDWCLQCHVEASTVYRVVDGDLMQPLLQMRVTYLSSFFCMPIFYEGEGGGSSRVLCDFSIRDGSSHLVMDRSTTTTLRDWGKNEQY